MNTVLILGGIIIDKYKFIDQYPSHGTDTFISESFDVPGGCSLNVAVTLKNLGCNPYIFSKIGNDSDGKKIETYLENKALNTGLLERVDGETDYCLVMVDGQGERTFFTHEKLDREISVEMLSRILAMDFESVYITGYFLVKTSVDSNKLKLIKGLSDKGAKILFDPGAIVGEIDQALLEQVIKLSDILTPNKFEVQEINGRIENDLKNIIKDTCFLIEKDGGKELSITLGNQVFSKSPYKTEIVDTTGAGDSFAAGVLYGLSQDFDIEKAVEVGMACGALTTTFKEPHGNFDVERVEKIIENGRLK